MEMTGQISEIFLPAKNTSCGKPGTLVKTKVCFVMASKLACAAAACGKRVPSIWTFRKAGGLRSA